MGVGGLGCFWPCVSGLKFLQVELKFVPSHLQAQLVSFVACHPLTPRLDALAISGAVFQV